jgi:hypothetical protein
MSELGALTYHAIAALTRERLAAIEALLLAKIRSRIEVSPLERQVHFLAKTACEALSLAPHLPHGPALPAFAQKLSLQAVFGSIGPAFPKFSALFAPGQRFLFDTLRAGTPDPHRERVWSGSTDFLQKLGERGTALINASDVSDKPAEHRKLRAYLLGHACHIAADLVSAPFVEAVSGQPGDATRAQLTPEQVSAALESAAARLFRPDLVGSPELGPRGDIFQDWWLDPGDLPARFFDAFKEALDLTYGPGARPRLRPSAAESPTPSPQVSRGFWEKFQADAPPELSVRLLEDGYATFRSAMAGKTWSFADWLAGTAWIFFPPIAAYPLILALPHTRALFKDGARVDGGAVDRELGWFGLAMAPLVTSALAPLLLSIYIASVTRYGVGRETVFGWITGGLTFVSSIVFLASIGKNIDPVIRWLLLFILPFVGLLVHAIYVLSRPGSNTRHRQLALGSLIPCIIVAAYILFHLAWHQSQDLGMNGWLGRNGAEPEGFGNAGFIGGWVLWAALLIGAWLLVSYLLQLSKEAEPAADQFVLGQKHFLALYGHSSLFCDPNLAAAPADEERHPTLATHYFPSEARPLIKLWWTGPGELWLRSERNALHFSTSEDGTADLQTLLAPTAPMTVAQFAAFLSQAIKTGAAFDQDLEAEAYDPEDFDYVLAPGSVFAAGGDDQTTLAAQASEASRFRRISGTRGDATLLHHAARRHLAGFSGKQGPLIVDDQRASSVVGTGLASFTGVMVTGSAEARFTLFFEPGDVIATTGATGVDETRSVVSVQNDRQLTVSLPFTLAVAGAPLAYSRGVSTRDQDTPAGTLQLTQTFRVYQGAGFEAMFLPGDRVRAVPAAPGAPEERTVLAVLSATEILLDRPFGAGAAVKLPPEPGVACLRVGRLTRDGFAYAPRSASGGLGGDSLMDRAADLGAILCMGAVTHLLHPNERQAVTTGLDAERRPAVNPVQQVFRNWNLNQRRLNEWHMLVGGGAFSEKRGVARDTDPLLTQVASRWTALTPAGEDVANRVGWVPLLQRWLEVARRPAQGGPDTQATRPGDLTREQLNQGIAFLLDLSLTT